jgi:hypothetical protein
MVTKMVTVGGGKDAGSLQGLVPHLEGSQTRYSAANRTYFDLALHLTTLPQLLILPGSRECLV